MKDVLFENLVTAKKTGIPVAFVIDGVRVEMRRIANGAIPVAKRHARPTAKRPRPKKPSARKALPTPAD